MSELKKGAVLNYVTIILINLVGLVLTPFIVNKLGNAEYGVYTSIGALIGSISLLDFGLNNTIVRFVAKYRAEKDRVGEENFLATTMLIYMIISILVICIGVVFYFYIEDYFIKMTSDEIAIAEVMFLILIFNLAIQLPGGAFMGICTGYEKFVFPKTLNIVRYIVRSILVLTVLLLGGRAISIVILDSVLNIIIIISTATFVVKKLKVRFKLHKFNFLLVKEILGYSFWIFIFALVGVFQWEAGHIVLGRFSVSEVLAIYAIGIMLGSYYGAFSTAISSVFLPKAAQMSVANATGEELTDMMIKIGRLSFIVLMYILGAFLLYGKQFVFLWVGEAFYDAWIIALMIMVAYTLPLVQGFGNSILEAKNKISFKAILYLVFLFIGTVIGALFAKEYGAIGMVTGSIVGWLIVQNVMNVYYYKVIKINILRFFKELLNKFFLIFLLIVMIGYGINYLPGDGWINFVIKGVCYTIVFGILAYNFGMIEFEKDLVRNALKFVRIKMRRHGTNKT